jgi:hypothetical protein
MKHNFYRNCILRVTAALVIVIAFSLTTAPPAYALDLNPADYFTLAYEPVAFDKTEVAPGAVFHAVIKGRATCSKDLPVNVTAVSITSQVVARPAAGGADLVLNPEYTVAIKPPQKAGEFVDINQTVTLQFPANAAPGSYNVIGKLKSASVTIKILFVSSTQDVTGYLQQESSMGTVKCAVPVTTVPPSQTAYTTLPKTVTTYPASTISNMPSPSITIGPPDQSPPTVNTLLIVAVIVIGLVAVALVIVIIVLVRRHNRI